MKGMIIPITALSALVLSIVSLPASADDESGLVTWMGRLQYYTHKLGLAVSAQNRPLQGYYVHEVEEVIEHLEEIQDVDDIAIGALVKSNLVPAFEALEGAVEAGDRERLDRAYDGLISACNNCHKAAHRPYIHIERRSENPYLQAFSPMP